MGLFPPSPGGGREVAHGFEGKGTLLHLLVDRLGNGVAITTTAANGDERREVEKLLNRVEEHLNSQSLRGRMVVLQADRGYDCAWLRQALLIRNIFPLIPYRKISGRENPKMQDICQTFGLTKNRWVVERAFAWLKRRCRRLMLRWERLPKIWSGFATLGLVYTWLKNLVG